MTSIRIIPDDDSLRDKDPSGAREKQIGIASRSRDGSRGREGSIQVISRAFPPLSALDFSRCPSFPPRADVVLGLSLFLAGRLRFRASPRAHTAPRRAPRVAKPVWPRVARASIALARVSLGETRGASAFARRFRPTRRLLFQFRVRLRNRRGRRPAAHETARAALADRFRPRADRADRRRTRDRSP